LALRLGAAALFFLFASVDVRDRGADAIAALEYDDLIAALHVCIVDVAAMEDIMVIAISSVVADGFMRKPRAAA